MERKLWGEVKAMNNFAKQFAVFVLFGIITVLIYFIEIGIYCRISADQIIFFASIAFALADAVITLKS